MPEETFAKNGSTNSETELFNIDKTPQTTIQGNVVTGGGDFVGRDKVVHYYYEKAYDVRGLPNPYLGLRAFTYEERSHYGGREDMLDHAVKLLTTPGEQRTIFFITGASGSGKSSYVQAGLLPALETFYQQRKYVVRWAVFRPSRQPLAGLADALLRLG